MIIVIGVATSLFFYNEDFIRKSEKTSAHKNKKQEKTYRKSMQIYA